MKRVWVVQVALPVPYDGPGYRILRTREPSSASGCGRPVTAVRGNVAFVYARRKKANKAAKLLNRSARNGVRVDVQAWEVNK